jgi:methylglyoxal synthase
MRKRKHIALIAHDSKKPEMLDWVKYNLKILRGHTLYATGTTGTLLAEKLRLDIIRMESGPLGGDLQIGALIAQRKMDLVIFFWDPLESQPHDPDVRALLRIAAVWNVPLACNRSTADFMISSPLMQSDYEQSLPDYKSYRQRLIGEAPK